MEQNASSSTEEIRVAVAPHPLLRLTGFATVLPDRVSDTTTPGWLTELLQPDVEAPLRRDETVRLSVRDMLRHGGYKPTGRGKPASEYLVRAAEQGKLGSINLVVDACNAVSLHSGLPISVIDLDLAEPPFRVALASAGQDYVFNPAGQTIDLGGLLCLSDVCGPCANPVKDSMRTRTRDETRKTLSLVYASEGFEDRLRQATEWYRALLERAGAVTAEVVLEWGDNLVVPDSDR